MDNAYPAHCGWPYHWTLQSTWHWECTLVYFRVFETLSDEPRAVLNMFHHVCMCAEPGKLWRHPNIGEHAAQQLPFTLNMFGSLTVSLLFEHAPNFCHQWGKIQLLPHALVPFLACNQPWRQVSSQCRAQSTQSCARSVLKPRDNILDLGEKLLASKGSWGAAGALERWVNAQPWSCLVKKRWLFPADCANAFGFRI